MRNQLSLLTLLAVASGAAQAHEGAHAPGLLANLWHLLSEPSHWLLLAVMVAVGSLGVSHFLGRFKNGKTKENRQ